jgi:hypothetical protein
VSRRLSLPPEHGGYLTAAGGGLGAALVAPDATRALAVGTAVLAAFLARGVVDRLAVGHAPRSWDRPWLAALAALALVATTALLPRDAALTGGLCLGLLAVSVAVRRTRHHRDAIVETLAMVALGASAGWAALAAGAPLVDSATIGLVLAVNAALAVPLVRTQLRSRERGRAATAAYVSLSTLALAAIVIVLLGRAPAALALLPRAVHAGIQAMNAASGPPAAHDGARPRAALVGIRETVLLVVTVFLLACALA